MLESESKKELTGIARSIDQLFVQVERAASASGAPGVEEALAEPAAPPSVEDAIPTDEVAVPVAEVGEMPPPLPSPSDEWATPIAATGAEAIAADEAPAATDGASTAAAEAPVAAAFEGREAPTPELEVEDAGLPVPPMEDDQPDAAIEMAAGPAGSEEEEAPPTELDLAVDAYLQGEHERAAEVERVGREMVERRELDPVARAVVRLAAAAGEPLDSTVYAVAESIIEPTVLEHVVRRLGSERVDEARQQYYQACRAIGEPMAHALRDGLGDTSTDRLARHNYCDALLAMGEVSLPTIEAMVLDDNRFLARNAISMLGDIGGERSLELVTAALGNPDARVRRAALRSLAKIGDQESGAKIMELGLLSDSDDDVRIAAATTAGELRVRRALNPLIAMLEGTKDADRAIPVIRALGQLEDPGVVPLLEKWAVPSLFSKPRTDARITAYRALYSIGTPHAMKLLAKASSDKDPEVQSAVIDIRRSARGDEPGEGTADSDES